jgi:hypothetical protein
MSRKLMSVHVRGDRRDWGFNFYGDPAHLEDWRGDGLEVYEVENVIPAWVVALGVVRPFCFLQDLFYFKNPFNTGGKK